MARGSPAEEEGGGGERPTLLPAARGRCLPSRARAAGHHPASGGAQAALPLPLARRPLRPWLVVMAAAASLSPEELLPKGGSGKAEELEDELEEEEDDEEVAGRLAAGRAGPDGRAG